LCSLVLLASSGLCLGQAAHDTAAEWNAQQMREDLVYLRDTWLPMDKSFTAKSRQKFEALVSASIAKVDKLSPADFALDVARAVASSRNGHTEAAVGGFLNRLPYRAWWFSDGLYIVRTHPDFSHLLDARVERIGKLAPEEALQLVAPFISGTDERIRVISPVFLTSPQVLRRIGATRDPMKVAVTVRLQNGKRSTLNLGPQQAPDPQAGASWSVLIPGDPDMAGRWPHVLDNVRLRPPIYREPVNAASEWIGAGGKVLYARLYERGIPSLEDKLIGILSDEVAPRKPKYVIIDLRLNTGGDFFKSTLFAQALPRLIPPDGKIFVLIGPVTFSAALVTASMLKANGGDKVLFVGERMGDSARFWAEGHYIPLPNSRIPVRASLGFQDWGAGCRDTDPCIWPAAVFGVRNISLEPDIEVATSFDDYAAGDDAVLAAALERARD